MTEQLKEKAPMVPKAFGDWYLVQPAIPQQETADGRVVIPDNIKDQLLCYGLVVAAPGVGVGPIEVGDAVFFNRSASIEKVPTFDGDGVPDGFGRYIAVHRSTIMLHWKVEGYARERLLNPHATPPDHEWAKQMKNRIELQ